MPAIGPRARIVRNADLLQEVVGDDIVMMDASSGRCFGLNPVGGRIWALLESPLTFADLCDALTVEYEIGRDECEAQVGNLLGEMAAAGLVGIDPA